MPMVATTGTASGTLAKLQASVSADGLSASRGSVTFVTDDDSALTRPTTAPMPSPPGRH